MRPLTLLMVLVVGNVTSADGMIYKRRGDLVPEREQSAFIEWENGIETLHVATVSDARTDDTVWMVPVRAEPRRVQAKPTLTMPGVVFALSYAKAAAREISGTNNVAIMLLSGGLIPTICCGFSGCGGEGLPKSQEHARTAEYGMVVTVVSAQTRGGLEEYLVQQGVNTSKIDLRSLEPYFGNAGYSFVCGWSVDDDEPFHASALRIEFPSPNVWFPLLPSRVYREPIATAIYVRGYHKPAPGCEFPGMRCTYAKGPIGVVHVDPGLSFAFYPEGRAANLQYAEYAKAVPLTHVEIPADPSAWERDLELVPGMTDVGTIEFLLNRYIGELRVSFFVTLEAMIGALLPLYACRREDRRWSDYVAGAVIGAAVIFTIWASILVFRLWRRQRFSGPSAYPDGRAVFPAFIFAFLAVTLTATWLLGRWLEAA